MWDRHKTFSGIQINATEVQARPTDQPLFDVIGPNLATDMAENEHITGYHTTCKLNQITFMSYTRLD